MAAELSAVGGPGGGVRALAGFFLLILTSPTSNAIGNVITQQVCAHAWGEDMQPT